MGRTGEAEPLFRQALEIGEKTIGTAHPDYATNLNNLAGLLRDMGRRDEAGPLIRQALEIDAKTIGTAHPDYAIRLNNFAGLLKEMGRIEEARSMLDEAVAIRRKSLGEDHPDYAAGLWWKADFARAGGDWDAARTINPPGQSGDPQSPHYRDHGAPWARNDTVPMLYSRDAVLDATEAITVLEPK